MIREINLEMTREHFGPRRLDRVFCFGLGGGDLDPPRIASLHQGFPEDQTSRVSTARLAARERRDQQSIAVGLEPAQRRSLTLGLGHQTETEIQEPFAMKRTANSRGDSAGWSSASWMRLSRTPSGMRFQMRSGRGRRSFKASGPPRL